MKIGILTFHNAHNYGAVLQAYALRTVLRRKGHDVHIINYQNPAITASYPARLPFPVSKRDVFHRSRWKNDLRAIRQWAYSYASWRRQWVKFDAFLGKVLLENDLPPLSLQEVAALDLDCYICGSDQIWTDFLTGGLDPVYFLDFPTKARKISYGASIFTKQIPPAEVDYFRETLSRFDAVSVREANLAAELSNLLHKPVTTVLDPSMLLDAADYNLLCSSASAKQKYVFAYFLMENDIVSKCATAIAQKLDLPLLEMHFYKQYGLRGHNQRADFGPEDFLNHIRNAEFVVTNSFHGTVFSILYQKPFYSVFENDARKESILQSLDLSDRHIFSTEQIDLDTVIDYPSCHEKLRSLRQSSLDFLDTALC